MNPRLCLVFVLLHVAPLSGQAPKPLPGDAAIERYLKDDVAAASKNFLDGAKTLAEWQKRRSRLKQE